MNAPHPLAQLIQSVKDGTGWTDREISRRVAKAGMSLSHSYVGKLQNHPVTSLTADTIRALATGLGIPEADVATAAIGSMGVHIDNTNVVGLDAAIASDQSLTDYDKRLLRSLVKEMRTNGEQSRDDQHVDRDDTHVPSAALSDGATGGLDDTAHRPLPEDVYGLAASRGRHGRAEMDKRAAEAGEESQDPAG